MAFVCDRCGKGSQKGCRIGRARQGLNYRSPKTFRPNLHPYKGELDGQKGRWKLCTQCLRLVKKKARSILPSGSLRETVSK